MAFEMRSWRGWSVGDRVVVRRRLPPDEPSGHLYTDVVGVVLAVDDDGVTVRPDPARPGRAGREPVHIAAGDVVGAKRVPPRPRRREAAPD